MFQFARSHFKVKATGNNMANLLMCAFLLSLGFAIADGQFCDTSGLARCDTEFLQDSGVSSDGSDLSSLNRLTPSERTDLLCRNYVTYSACFHSKIRGCDENSATNKVYTYTEQLYGYLCNDGRADYTKHSSCWFNTAMQTEIRGCLQTFGSITSIQEIQKICPLIDQFLTCAGDKVYNRCGKDAAAVYTTFTSYTQLIAYSSASCPEIKETFATASNNPYKTGKRVPNSSTKQSCSLATGFSLLVILLNNIF